MNDYKYKTIDPLILQTLNLNEKRMNNIIDILHGTEHRQIPKSERKIMNKSLIKNTSISIANQQQQSLPPILLSQRKKGYMNEQKDEIKTYRRLNRNKSIDNIIENPIKSANKTIEKVEKKERNYKYFDRQFKNRKSGQQEKQLKNSFNHIIPDTQQQSIILQQLKKQRLMKDYMLNKLKKSKSMQINRKDIYRLQIQSMVAELTPIQQLQQAENKMKILKIRHKHLYSFDKKYYTKLNQHDMIVLS